MSSSTRIQTLEESISTLKKENEFLKQQTNQLENDLDDMDRLKKAFEQVFLFYLVF